MDIVQILTQQPDYQTARKYWNKLKERLGKEGSQSVTNCHQLKLEAADGKMRLTDVANAETLLRLVQSVPSPKAEPIKLWLAKVGYERMQEMADPARALERARATWQKHGRSDKWIQQRMTGQETRNKLTDYWARTTSRNGGGEVAVLHARLAGKSQLRQIHTMSKAQILEELPRLTVSDRSQLFARLAELHEADLLDGGSPSPAERQALDEALADFERDPSPGEPWRDVFRQIRESRR